MIIRKPRTPPGIGFDPGGLLIIEDLGGRLIVEDIDSVVSLEAMMMICEFDPRVCEQGVFVGFHSKRFRS